MKLFYYQDPGGNFGDDLNTWLWPRLIPGLLDGDESSLFVGIGSILDRRIPQRPLKVVFGTGVGYGLLPVLDSTWRILCVRGPLTAKALGLPSEAFITDSAALVSTLRQRSHVEKYPTSFMPHFRTPARAASQGLDLPALCANVGLNYIDPCGDVEATLAAIEDTGMLIAEAMHGAIVADALRVPWVPVQLGSQIRNLKWLDWCGSLGLDYHPAVFASDPTYGLDAAVHRFLHDAIGMRPLLSETHRLARATTLLQEQLDALRGGNLEVGITGSARFKPDPQMLREVPWLYEMQAALEELAHVVPDGVRFILVDEDRWGGGQVLAGRHTVPFMEHKGAYWGLPANDAEAIAELERLRGEGALYIAFMWPSFWWLDFYTGLHQHLRHHFKLLRENEIMVVFGLQEG